MCWPHTATDHEQAKPASESNSLGFPAGSLLRSRVVYALGHARVSGHAASIRLHSLLATPPRHYTLTIVVKDGAKSVTFSRAVTV